MRTAGARLDINLFIVGDQTFGPPPERGNEYLPFNYLDAVTNYDIFGTLPKPYATAAGMTKYYRQQAQWRELARTQVCKFIPSVSPGYNDRAIRIEKDHPPLSRKLDGIESSFGSLFKYALRKAIPQVDRGMNYLLMVNSFNEWHEDTQIEPVNGTLTTMPYKYTQGIEYEGYGTRYLDILMKMTTDGSWIADEEEDINWLEQLEGMDFTVDKPKRPPKSDRPQRSRPQRKRRRHDVFDAPRSLTQLRQ
jgi:glycoprotein endo-alpha-1,2-mannosidase